MQLNPLFLLGLILLGLLTVPSSALAWGPNWGGGYGNMVYGHGIGYGYPGVNAYQNGYDSGQQEATYDHTNNLQYNPIGNCIPCHSQLYWNGFHQGYDQQWNSYSQEQSSTQGASINIYGNNYGTASIGQSNTQGQSLGQLPHIIGQGLCNLGFSSGCAYAQGQGQQGGYNPDP